MAVIDLHAGKTGRGEKLIARQRRLALSADLPPSSYLRCSPSHRHAPTMFTTVRKPFVASRLVCPVERPTSDQQIDPIVNTRNPEPVTFAPRLAAVIIAAIIVAIEAIQPAISSIHFLRRPGSSLREDAIHSRSLAVVFRRRALPSRRAEKREAGLGARAE